MLLGYRAGSERVRRVSESLRERFEVNATPLRMDLRDTTKSLEVCMDAVSDVGDLTCLVNNAGVNDRTPVVELDERRMNEVFAINSVTPILLASRIGGYLAERGTGGSIVNVTSIHETSPISGGSIYCASKGALGMATKVLALELAAHGVRANSVAPGETATAMNHIAEDSYENVHRPVIPMGRPGGVNEVAQAIAFLAGNESSYINGASLTVDGGLQLAGADENARFAQADYFKSS